MHTTPSHTAYFISNPALHYGVVSLFCKSMSEPEENVDSLIYSRYVHPVLDTCVANRQDRAVDKQRAKKE